MKTQYLLAGASFACLALVSPAVAKSTDDSNTASTDHGEIIVTAQRRQEKLQNLNIAATAVSGDTLAERNVVRQLDVQNIAPGISIVKAGLTESINIRGIGLASGSPAVSNGVSNYLDGVFQPPIVSTGSFYDIANIELLRGPQGTLVGSSSTGGALLINTNRPQLDRTSVSAGAEYGSYNHAQGDAAINLPLGHDFAIRAAGLIASRDSYYTDLGPLKNKPDSLHEYDGRIGLLFRSGGFQNYFKIEAIDKNTGGYAYQPILGTPLAAGRTNIPYVLAYNAPTYNYERANIFVDELKYQFDNGLVIRSVTGYQNKRINNAYDSDATLLAASTQLQFVRERQYSEEINVISDAAKPLNFILGGYFQRNKVDVVITNGNAAGPTVPVSRSTAAISVEPLAGR